MDSQIKLFVLDKRNESQLAKSIWLASSQMGINIKHIKNPVSLSVSRQDIVTLFVHVETIEDMAVIEGISDSIFFLIAVYDEKCELPYMDALERGFTSVFKTKHLSAPGFTTYLKNVLNKGSLSSEETYISPHEQLLETALSYSPDAFIIFDVDKKIIYASEHYYRFYPSFKDVVLKGMSVTKALEVMKSEQEPAITSENMDEIERFWTNLAGNIEVTLSDGKCLRLIAKDLPNNMGYLITTTDITSYNQQKLELEEQTKTFQNALEKEQKAGETQKQFVNMVSHEFRTPLTIIDGNAQVLQQNADTIEPLMIKQKSSTIRKSIARLIDLMEGLLSSNMLDSGQFEISLLDFDLKTLIEDLAQEYRDLSPAITIETEITNIPDAIFADKKSISLILANLLSNAIKFSKDGTTVRVTAELVGRELFLQVSDQGIGIPEKDRGQIFDRFYRASNTTGISGSGIGLDLVKQLTTLQNGGVKIYSKENQGTDISITIPLEAK